VPLAAEVHSFQAEVGGYQDLETGRTLENRGIVSDAGAHGPLAARAFSLAANATNQFFLGQGQVAHTLQCRGPARHYFSVLAGGDDHFRSAKR
jgi:hypothetical protein